MINVGEVYESKNCGKFVVVGYNGALDVSVKFIETGSIVKSRSGNVNSGRIKDRLRPVVCGVGFIGVGAYKAKLGGSSTKSYKVWGSMLERCYSDRYQAKKPSYIGCSVCKEWHNFQNFAEWFESNYIDGFSLDKDIKIKGNKIYSPSACMFVSTADNTIEASAKSYRFTDHSGETVEIYNLSYFCRENNLDVSNMVAVNSGRLTQHKGWTKSD